jgi:hypothetical protein
MEYKFGFDELDVNSLYGFYMRKFKVQIGKPKVMIEFDHAFSFTSSLIVEVEIIEIIEINAKCWSKFKAGNI